MTRPKRQTRKPGKYDEEFIIPAEAAEMYWEANTRKVYRFLTERDVKSSLKHSTVYILWPGDGKWYLAEVEELNVPELIANLRYPETHEEEEVDLQELIREKCIAVVEHLPRATKLKKGREVPCTDADAEGAEYESSDEADIEQAQQQRQQQQQHSIARQPSARKPRAPDDDDYDAEQDSDAVPMSDEEKLDSDAHVSDDQAPSASDEESVARTRAKKLGSGQLLHSSQGAMLGSKQQRSSKLNTPSKGNNKPSRTGAAAGSIRPVSAPGLLPVMSADGTAAAGTGSMMFVPMGATGTASAAGNGPRGSEGSGEMIDLQQQQQGMLGKRRTSEGSGMPSSEAKRRAATAAAREAAGAPAGSDAFKKAMLEKLLAKRQQAAGPGTGGPAAAADGSARVGTTRLARGVSGTERRLSGSGSVNLQRASSDVDVRQKAAGQLAVGLKKAVQEAQGKHKAEQQQQQGDEGVEQQQEDVGQQVLEVSKAAAAGSETQQQPDQREQQPREGEQIAAVTAEVAGQVDDAAAVGNAQETGQGEQQQQHQHQPVLQQDLLKLQLPDPQKLATTIEQQLYDLCGSLNAEYKSKMRSLVFNLRDPQNPDLRAHVLTGQILPDQLVRMSAADLANKDLAEWRRKIEEEHNKAIELDLETAAKYSTAAAWATREDRLRRTQMALLGTLAAEDNTKRSTPEPSPAPGAAAGGSKGSRAAKRNRRASDSGAAAVSDSREGQSMSEAEGDATAEAGTPTQPASDAGEDEIADTWLSTSNGTSDMAAAAATAAAQPDGTDSPWQQIQQLASPTADDHPAASDVGMLAAPRLSQGGTTAGSAADVSASLHQVSSVTSKAPVAAGGIFAGIDWAAIKLDAVKASQEKKQQPQQAADDKATAAVAAPIEDAPYNPDDDDEEQPYDPTEGNDHDLTAHGTPSAAAGTPAAAAAGTIPASSGRPGHLEPPDPNLPDMLPVVAAARSSRSSSTGQNWPTPGDAVWTGRFLVPAAGSFTACVQHLAGLGEVGLMLGPAGAAVEVIGRVALDKFAAFAEELRKSRSRTISLGLVCCAAGADAVDAAYMHELLQSYSSKGRIGKLGLARDVEGYLVANSDLTARLLKTAILVTPPSQQHLVPRNVSGNEFLLLLVHRKDFIPPKPVQLPPPPPPQQQLPGAGGNDDVVKLDPRRRAAMTAVAGPQQQQLPPDAVVPAPPSAAGPVSTPPSGLASQGAMPAALVPPPPAAGGAPPAASMSMPPQEAAAAAVVGAGSVPSAVAGLDLHSLSALALALGLPGGPPQPSAAPAAGDAAAILSAAAAAAGDQPGEQTTLQLQPMAGAGLAGPPPPPSAASGPGQQTFSPSQGPASAGAQSGLLAALHQAAGLAGDLTNQQQQQQQQQYTVDMRALHPPGGPDQSLVFDLRQAQQQQQQQQQLPDLAAPGPPPGSAGGAPVIILPPGAPVPALGSMGIPEGAVFMTQDPATGALVPVGPPPPPPPPPQHMMQPSMQQFPGPPGPPPPPGYGVFEGQMVYPGPFGVEGPDGCAAVMPPPPPGGPRGPGGGTPRPMMRRY